MRWKKEIIMRSHARSCGYVTPACYIGVFFARKHEISTIIALPLDIGRGFEVRTGKLNHKVNGMGMLFA